MKSIAKHMNVFALLLASIIWGSAFVAQTTGGDAIGPFGFNCIRNLLAAIVLIPVVKILDILKLSGKGRGEEKSKKMLWIGGVVCGTALFIASSLQQVGINMGTSTGKAGFLTTLYILMVPILGLFLKKKCGFNIWIGVLIALIGMFLLCRADSLGISVPEILLILCAFSFSIQILAVDHFAPLTDNVRLAQIQFLTCGVLSIIPMIMSDWHHSVSGFIEWNTHFWTWDAWGSLLFAAVLSSGVAYTLQIVGQNNMNPTVASMLMSLESVFSAIAGFLFLHQVLEAREIWGCVLIFSAVIIAQLPISSIKKKNVA